MTREEIRTQALAAIERSKSPDANPSPEADALQGIGLALVALHDQLASVIRPDANGRPCVMVCTRTEGE